MTAQINGEVKEPKGTTALRPAVFLDRDGVINAMVYNAEFGLVDSPANLNEFKLLPGAGDAIRRIREMGYLAVVISNQPGVAKGKFSPQLLDAMTAHMIASLNEQGADLDAIYYCRHHPDGIVEEYRKVCQCRKPKPGMLLAAASEMGIDLDRSYFIGDGITDVQAGKAAGVTAVLIYPSSRCYLCEELTRQNVQPDHIVQGLLNAVDLILKKVDPSRPQIVNS